MKGQHGDEAEHVDEPWARWWRSPERLGSMAAPGPGAEGDAWVSAVVEPRGGRERAWRWHWASPAGAAVQVSSEGCVPAHRVGGG